MKIRNFSKKYFRHFNARTLVDAAEAWVNHEGPMMLTLAGGMSSAEIGISLAEMIRKGKVNAICSTPANVEEDIFNLIAHKSYKQIPNWRDLSPEDDMFLESEGLNRVLDVAIPEEAAIRKLEEPFMEAITSTLDLPIFPHEVFYHLIKENKLEYQIDPRNSWMVAAAERNLPLFVPTFEDSTMGNIYAARLYQNVIKEDLLLNGISYMHSLIDWYKANNPCGIFCIGGGAPADFTLCVVPLLNQDMEQKVAKWDYYAQITDAVTSYGGFSGASASEKQSWAKIDRDTLTFVINSDATVCFPLIAAYVLDQ